MVELKIGFPEMKLSAELIDRLGTSIRQTVTREVNSEEAVSRIVAHEPDDRAAYEHHNGNGFTHKERARSAADDRMHESRFSTQAMADPEPMTLEWDGPGQEEHWDGPFDDASGDDHAMVCFQDTMQAFLRTQQEVMAAYLGASTADSLLDDGACEAPPSSARCDTVLPEPGPWAGEILRLVAGAEVETQLILEAHDDPIAQHHTLGGRKISAQDPSLLGLPVLPFAVMAEMAAQVGRPCRRSWACSHGLKCGSSPQVGALRGRAGLSRAARASCVVRG